MKKLILLLSITLLFSCSKGDDVYIIYEVPIEAPIVNANDNCWAIISMSSAYNNLTITVIPYKDFIKMPVNYQVTKINLCIQNGNMNDFKLDQIICDLTIYQRC